MNLEIFIDNCAFDELYKNNVDLRTEFPEKTVCFKITKAVKGEIEDIPDNKPDKKLVKTYALNIIESEQIKDTSFFGLGDGGRLWSGLDEGEWASKEQSKFLDDTKSKLGSPRKLSGIQNNAADIDMLAQSFGKIVITTEKTIGGSLSTMSLARATVINIKDYGDSGYSLRDFILMKVHPSGSGSSSP